MKKQIIIILAVTLLFCMTACVNTQPNTSSEETLLSGQATLSETETLSSKTEILSPESSKKDTVTSTGNSSAADTSHNPAVASLPSSSAQTSSVNNPYVSYNDRGQLVHVNPAPKGFGSNEEMVEYLKSIDLREKEFDVIADENIYLIPRIVDEPKSKAAKKGAKYIRISTSVNGGTTLTWRSDTEKHQSTIWGITWYTAEKHQNDSIQTPQDLANHVKNVFYSSHELSAEIVEGENRFYVLINDNIYWLHEGKYLVSVSNSLNFGDRDELLLLAQDIVFDKHTLK